MPDKTRLLRRIFGAPNAPKDWPGLQAAWASAQINNPQDTKNVTSLGEMGPISKFFHPDTYGVTNPITGTINLNKNLIQNEKQDVGDVLTHEMVHTGQGIKGFLKSLYDSSSVENPAIDKEAMRKKSKDVYLKKEK